MLQVINLPSSMFHIVRYFSSHFIWNFMLDDCKGLLVDRNSATFVIMKIINLGDLTVLNVFLFLVSLMNKMKARRANENKHRWPQHAKKGAPRISQQVTLRACKPVIPVLRVIGVEGSWFSKEFGLKCLLVIFVIIHFMYVANFSLSLYRSSVYVLSSFTMRLLGQINVIVPIIVFSQNFHCKLMIYEF